MAQNPHSYLRLKRFAALLGVVCITLNATNDTLSETDWTEYNGGPDKNHYSPLAQINTGNVNKLRVAWQYASGGADTVKNTTQMQCNPLVIKGILYGVSAGSQAFALDAATGREIWKTGLSDDTFNMTSRGVSYWSDGQEERIFFAYGAFMYALNARDGKPVETFGRHGKIYLKDGIMRPGADDYVVANTPPSVFRNILIVGTRVSESASALLGDVRAYDVKSGKLIWTFRTIPRPGEYGYQTWEKDNYRNVGGANSWMGMAVDHKRGIVFVPTGSAAFDFYGGNRKGDNLFANCLIAINATTGKRIWHYQTVHHDIWDRDIPAPPNLFTITRNGRKIDVVSVVSKQGFTFVFDRATGKPVFPIEERSFPASDIPGERAARTQPVPLLPEPFTRQSFTVNDVNGFASGREEIIELLKKSKTGSPFIPLGRERTLFFPGSDGGAQWGGAAVDENSVMYVPAKENPVFSSIVDAPNYVSGKQAVSGRQLYQTYCASCHGADREGNHDGTIPGLLTVMNKYNKEGVLQIMAKGRGMMPAFTQIKEADRQAIIDFLGGKNTSSQGGDKPALSTLPYTHKGYNRWYDTNGYPVSTPPWGTLTAIDMNTGKRQWQVPLGEYPELTAKGIPPTGTDNYGCGAVTAGGLIFIASSKDEMFRVFDRKTGEILWQTKLPAAGYASPSVYAVNGRQYVVIACGGGKLRSKSGDRYVAFALP